MRVLVTIIAPIYWSLAHSSGAARSGFLLTQGTFQHESLLQFATGEGSLMESLVSSWGCSDCISPCIIPDLGMELCVGCCGVLLTVLPRLWGAAHHSPLSVGCCSLFSPGCGVLLTVPPWQGSSCGSPTSPEARMALVLCGWTVSSVAPCRRALAMLWCC